ncbi:MAG: dihydrolipoamide acetyltransferase family protein [Verrucomicrobia bacterium]|nr:dihydrolipoamide acetyltransferase family protein [Verrucomicrobiota bacterium]
MKYEITLPEGIPSGERIVVGRWHKEIGDSILKTDVIVQVETPTTIMEIESQVEGMLGEILCDAGQEVTQEDILGIIEDDQPEPQAGEEAVEESEQTAEDETAEEENAGEEVTGEPVAEEAAVEEAAPEAEVPPTPATSQRTPITDRARWLAMASGVEIDELSGTGPGGRIIVRDVEEVIAQRKAAPETPSKETPAVAAKQVLLSPAEQVLAQRMSQAHRDVPQYDITVVADATHLIAWRKARKDAPRITAIMVKLSADALADHPRINATFLGRSWRPNTAANIAVAVDTPHGMVWPVLHNCQSKSLQQIADELADLATKGRDGKLTAHDAADANFSITNLGMYDVDVFNAVIWPGQTAVLAVGAIRQEAVVVSGAILPRHVVRLTLGCDRRVIEGAFGARYLARLKELIEKAKL